MKHQLIAALALSGAVALTSCGSSGPALISLSATSGSRTNFDSVAGKTGEASWFPEQDIVYDVSDSLPTMPDAADAYRISSPVATLSMFNTLAHAFDISVTPEILTKSDDTYRAVNISGPTTDGSTWLSLTSDGSTTGWYFSDSAAWGTSTWGCARSEPASGSGSGTSGDSSSDGETPAPDDGCTSEVPDPTPNLPSEADAKSKATALFIELGLNVSDAHVEFTKDDYVATVFAVKTVDNIDVPLQWTATFGEDGVLLSASGVFATFSQAGRYSLITPQEGVKRLTSLVYAGLPAYMAEKSAIDSATKVTIPITGVSMSLMQVWQTDGKSMLLPSFTYTNSDGIVGQVIAVEEKYITVPSTTDTTESSPPPTEPTQSTTPGTGTLDDTIPTIAPLTEKEVTVLLGLSEEEAKKVALGRGWGFRVASRDGVSFPLTADYSPTRVNVSVVADDVTSVSIG